MRPLLVDPSSHGGIASYTALVAQALHAAGAEPELLGSTALRSAPAGVPLQARLPVAAWGRPDGAGLGFFAGRAVNWLHSATVVRGAVARGRQDVVHFQAPINRRFDAILLRRLARRRPLVWTAHDVLPFEPTEGDRERFAAIYRAADRVIVHTEPAAAQVRELAGVEPAVIEHPVSDAHPRVERAEARRRLGLPVEGRILGGLGFVRAYKGYDLLAAVWEHLGEAAPTLLVMGEPFDDEQRALLARLERSGRAVLRLGFASDEELWLAACASDALVLPYVTASDSGLVHVARAAGVPVLASDAPQLAASVQGTGAGVAIPRDAERWAAAVTGELPPAPPAPPPLRTTGERHLAVYEEALSRRATARSFRLVLYTDADERGGAEGVLADLVAELDPAIDVTVMGTDPGVVDWVARRRPGARTRLVPPVRDKRDWRAILAHQRALLALRPDVFQANLRHPWSCQYGLAAALLTPRTKVVAVEHLPTPPTAATQLKLKRLLSRRLDAHIAVGDGSARELEALIGLRDGALQPIHNGVRAGAAPADAAPPASRPLVGAVGRLVPQKGYDLLLRALAELPDVDAEIVGDGPERAALEALRDELGLAQRVRMDGWVEDPSALLSRFDALALPSRFEAFPLVILEAMHAGLPVVAADVGSVAEAVIDGETGAVVPPEDVPALVAGLRRVLEPGAAARMGARAKEIAQRQFTLDRMAREYELVYRRLCS